MKSIVLLSVCLGLAGAVYVTRIPARRPVDWAAKSTPTPATGTQPAPRASSFSNGSNDPGRDLGNSLPLPAWGPNQPQSPVLQGRKPPIHGGRPLHSKAGERELPVYPQ